MTKTIFISWEKHQRTRSFCKKLAIELYEIATTKNGLPRYADVIPQTIKKIKQEKPTILFVQNPSIVLAFLAVLLKPFFGYKLYVDAHNEAVIPYIHNNALIRFLARVIIRFSDKTIVTNDVLANIVKKYSGDPLVLPDFLPAVEPRPYLHAPDAGQAFQITLISTYASDEPYTEVFDAVAKLGAGVRLKVTGKIPANFDRSNVPENVELMGFLSEHDYWETLFNSHIVIDLTTMENCLVCGAYECLAIEKPMLLSQNPASESLFGQYAHHVVNQAANIQDGLATLMTTYNTLEARIAEAKQLFIQQEQNRITELLNKL